MDKPRTVHSCGGLSGEYEVEFGESPCFKKYLPSWWRRN
jgi:hypothetical protein